MVVFHGFNGQYYGRGILYLLCVITQICKIDLG